MQHNKIISLSAGEGKKIQVGLSNLFLKLSSQAIDNRFSVTEYELSPHFPGPPAHQHGLFEHAWYVLDGNLNVLIDGQTSVIGKGGFVFIPKRTIHAFSNESDTVTKLLVIDTPGGFENYYEDLQSAFGNGETVDQELIREIQLKYDTYPPGHVFK
jgi:quercetin dioxygenase-like cupin family protein